MIDRIEILILRSLVFNEDYTRRVLPFIKPQYFTEMSERVVYEKMSHFILKYDKLPTKETLFISISKDDALSDAIESSVREIISSLEPTSVDLQWLLEQTESWCKDRALYLALMDSIKIADDKKGKLSKGSIPKILTDALSVSFDPNVGHNYLEDTDSRFDFYHKVEEKLPFDIDCLNIITKDGVPRKTLNVFTAVGKSLALCHIASSYFMQGKNVLYITLEMSEARIAERIDANLLNISLEDLHNIPKDLYDKRIKSLKSKTVGRLIIKEYPTASASSTHFRALLNELNLKTGFVPDAIFIDYLNIAISSRLTANSNANSYTYIKSIAEELRGLAVEFNLPIWTATQTNRQGYTSTDIGLENTSESFGLPATADFMLALSTSEELDKLGQILIKQLKNRYNDVSKLRRFVVGIDRSKMRLFDLEKSAQSDLIDTDLYKKNSDGTFNKTKPPMATTSEISDDFEW
jgi:replicative DNA helicase